MASPGLARSMAYLVILLAGASAGANPPAGPPPLDPGLTEAVETRLIQFELRVLRKGAPVAGLGAADFDIELGGKPLKAFTVDDMCAGGLTASGAAGVTKPGSFIFYFDEPELTLEGRQRAIEVARLVTPVLLSHGHDLLILHNGTTLRAETRWTHDAGEVATALDRIAADPGNGDSLRAANEEQQVQRLLDRAESLVRESDANRQMAVDDAYSAFANPPPCPSGAGSGQMGLGGSSAPCLHLSPAGLSAVAAAGTWNNLGNAELTTLITELDDLVENQLQRSQRDIDRLRGAVRSLSLRASPKGVVYFADTLRRDPGGTVQRAMEADSNFMARDRGASNRSANRPIPSGPRSRSAMASWTSDAALQALVRDASTYGARFYAVEGRGLAGPSDWVRTSQDTLVGLALETGGLSFVNGLAAARIADRIDADQSCWYLVSFNPSGWDTDRTLGVGVWGKRPGMRITANSSLVLPSRRALVQDRLIAAHLGDPTFDDRPLSLALYPVGGTARLSQVLAQVRLPDGEAPAAVERTWDIGIEIVSGGVVVAHTSHRMAWRGKGQPPVYQTTVSIPSGPYEIVAVAREVATDAIREGRASGTWPEFSADRLTVSRSALAQPHRGGIVQDGEIRASGIVIRGDGDPIDPREPVAIVTAACVKGPQDSVLRAERELVGDAAVSFAPIELTPDGGRCVQIRDLVAARSLGAGRLAYYLRVFSGDVVIASQQVKFYVADVGSFPMTPGTSKSEDVAP